MSKLSRQTVRYGNANYVTFALLDNNVVNNLRSDLSSQPERLWWLLSSHVITTFSASAA